MRKLLERLVSPLRQVDTHPDHLVVEAHRLLEQIPEYQDVGPEATALSSEATAKIALATYLREYRS
ncbi:hypothetical protein [Streptomyces sp. NPDC093589]|uniref:hypothetical protein n=1 Tax=Streptomyces sp. NPDC093589 TaxID=3366043 RepID=UPI00381B25E2